MASLQPPSTRPLLQPSFDEFALQLLEEWNVPGLALGIIKIGEPGQDTRVEFRNYGTAGRGRNVDEDTLFCIASNSKAFTAAAVGHFVDTGDISWDDKVNKLLPGFGLQDAFASEQADLIDILTHRTGLPRHEHLYSIGDTAEEVVGRLSGVKMSAEFRAEWQYNNLMYITASHLVSRLSQQPFTTFMSSHFFRPLGMESTTFTPLLDAQNISERLSASHIALPQGGATEVPFGFDLSFENVQLDAGAGGIVSSTRDMLKWVELLIKARQASESKDDKESSVTKSPVLSSSTVKQLTSSHTITEGSAPYPETSVTTYGLGFMMHNVQGVELIKHGGGMPGFGSQVMWSSRGGVGVVALTNVDGTGNAVADIVSYRAVEELLGLEHVDWNSRQREARAKWLSSSSEYDPIKDSEPPLPLESYLGTYCHPSYGEIVVCPTKSSGSLPGPAEVMFSQLNNAEHITPPPISASYALYIPRPGFFAASHIVLSPAAASAQALDAWCGAYASYHAPCGDRNHGLVTYYEKIYAEFAGDQLRLWGFWTGPGQDKKEEKRKKEGGERGDPEVVFERVRRP